MRIIIVKLGRDDWTAHVEPGNGQRATLDEAYNRPDAAIRGARRLIAKLRGRLEREMPPIRVERR